METTDSYRNVYWIARFWSCNKWSQQQLSLYHDLNRQITRVSWDSATGWQRFHWHGCQCWLIPPRYLLLICATATGYNVLIWYKPRNRSFQQQQKALASAKPLTVESRTNAWFWWRSKLHVIGFPNCSKDDTTADRDTCLYLNTMSGLLKSLWGQKKHPYSPNWSFA